MSRLPEEEFNFLLLHYLKRGRYAHLAAPLEAALAGDGALPKRTTVDGQVVPLSYNELVERYGDYDPSQLLSRLVWGAREFRQFPSTGGALIMHDPRTFASQDQQGMAVDASFAPVTPVSYAANRRLFQPGRGAKMCKDIRDANLVGAMASMRIGSMKMPDHLSTPLNIYNKFHTLARRRGHMNEVFFVMYDRTGTRMFTGSDDWLIKIWSTTTGLLVQTLRGHKAAITGMALDPSNRYLASSSDDNTIRVWSLETFSNVAVLQNAHNKPVVELSFSKAPHLSSLVSMSQDGFVRVWDLVPSRHIHDIDTILGKDTSLNFKEAELDCNSPIHSGCLSPCGTRALCSSKDGSVRIFSLNHPRLIQRIMTSGSKVPVTAWAHTADRFLASSDDGTTKIYEYRNQEAGWTLKATLSVLEGTGPKPKMHIARWSADDSLVVMAFQRLANHNNHNLKVYNANTGQLLGCLDGHTNDVHAIIFHPTDPRILVTAGYDQRLIFWNIQTLRQVSEIAVPNYEEEETPLLDIAFHPQGHQCVVSDLVGTFSIIGLGSPDSYRGPTEQFFSTDYNNTTMDANGWVVDTDSQLAPHLIQRTPLCFRGGRHHALPPVLPSLRDSRTYLSDKELKDDLLARKMDAEEEDAKFIFGEQPPRVGHQARVVQRPPSPIVNRTRNAALLPAPRNQPQANRVIDLEFDPHPAPVAPRPRGRPPNNPPPVVQQPLPPAQAATPTVNAVGRPARRAAIRASSNLNDLSALSGQERHVIEILRAQEDLDEDDFVASERESEEESVGSDGDGGQVSDEITDDLYWSGNESLEGRAPRRPQLTAAERAARRELARLQTEMPAETGSRPARGTRTRPAARPVSESDEDDDEDEEYGEKRKSKPKPKPKKKEDKKPAPKKEPLSDFSDSDVDIMETDESSDDIGFDDESDYEDIKPPPKKKQAPAAPNGRGRHKPAEYANWIKADAPSSSYCPQLGDEVVFFREGHVLYISKNDKFQDDIPESLPDVVFCSVTNLSYSSDPLSHAVVTLTTIHPLPNVPSIDSDKAHDPLIATVVTNKGTPKKLKVKLPPHPAVPSSDPRPYVSMSEAARQSLESSSSTGASSSAANDSVPSAPRTFSVHYHPDAPEFLVLASRFNQALQVPWYEGKRVKVWMVNEKNPTTGDYWPGTVMAVRDDSLWDALQIVWDDEASDTLEVGPWEVDSVDTRGNIAPIFSETLHPVFAQKFAAVMETFIKTEAELVEYFVDPVSLLEYPSYLNVNPYPIDLRLIVRRLRSNYYRTVAALRFDIQRIQDNSKAYNTDGPLTESATKITQHLLEALNANLPQVPVIQICRSADNSKLDESLILLDSSHDVEEESLPAKADEPKKAEVEETTKETAMDVDEPASEHPAPNGKHSPTESGKKKTPAKKRKRATDEDEDEVEEAKSPAKKKSMKQNDANGLDSGTPINKPHSPRKEPEEEEVKPKKEEPSETEETPAPKRKTRFVLQTKPATPAPPTPEPSGRPARATRSSAPPAPAPTPAPKPSPPKPAAPELSPSGRPVRSTRRQVSHHEEESLEEDDDPDENQDHDGDEEFGSRKKRNPRRR